MEHQKSNQIPDVVAHLAAIKQSTSELQSSFELLATQHGTDGFPKLPGEYAGAVVNPLQSQFQQLIDGNNRFFLPLTSIGSAQLLDNEAGAKKQKLQAKINHLQQQRKPLHDQAQTCKPNRAYRRLRKACVIGIGVISVCEGYFAFTGVRHATVFDVAVVAGIAIMLMTGMGAHRLAGWIRKATTPKQYWRRYICSMLPFAIGFSYLAKLRAAAYNYQPSYYGNTNYVSVADNVTAIPYAIISLGMFWMTLTLSAEFYKTNAERDREQKYDDLCKQIEEIDASIKELEAACTQIDEEVRIAKVNSVAIYETATNTENEIVTCANTALYAYNNTNHNFRPGRDYPDFFASTPALHFKTFFDNGKLKRS